MRFKTLSLEGWISSIDAILNRAVEEGRIMPEWQLIHISERPMNQFYALFDTQPPQTKQP